MNYLLNPWPWYVAGPLIGLIVPTLLIIGNKHFGISANLRHACAACFPRDIKFFNYDWKKEKWNFFFVIGIIIGASIAASYLHGNQTIVVNPELSAELSSYHVHVDNSLLPDAIFSWHSLFTLKGFILLVIGGFMVGFGARYAGGCTSGHAIMGLSDLQWPSLVATIAFMVGGFITANVLIPIILSL